MGFLPQHRSGRPKARFRDDINAADRRDFIAVVAFKMGCHGLGVFDVAVKKRQATSQLYVHAEDSETVAPDSEFV